MSDLGFDEWETRVARLEQRLGHVFGDRELLRTALTHTSYRNENSNVAYDNERLEFLGDAVVGCVISHLLWLDFPERPEGELTGFRALLVSAESLARQARLLQLGEHLLLGRGEELTGGRDKETVLADAFESIVAALYIDGGFTSAKRFLTEQFRERVESVTVDQRRAHYKAKVQELVQGELRSTPRYKIVDQSGPDHERRFEVELLVRGVSVARGDGRSKKDAEEDAARRFFEALHHGHVALHQLPEAGDDRAT